VILTALQKAAEFLWIREKGREDTTDSVREMWSGTKGHGGDVRINASLRLLSLLPQITTFSSPLSLVEQVGIHSDRSGQCGVTCSFALPTTCTPNRDALKPTFVAA
jgi:hypothetical protein